MPQKVFDASGKELGDFFDPKEFEQATVTKAEELVGSRLDSERENWEAKKKVEQEALVGELDDAKEKLAKLESKDTNFGKFREGAEKEKEGLQATIIELTKKVDEIGSRVQTVEQKPLAGVKATFVEKNIGSNKELAAKFEHYYAKLSVGATTEEQIQAALIESLALAGAKAGEPVSFLNKIVPTRGDPGTTSTASTETDDSKGFRQGLRISDADREKYKHKLPAN